MTIRQYFRSSFLRPFSVRNAVLILYGHLATSISKFKNDLHTTVLIKNFFHFTGHFAIDVQNGYHQLGYTF
jgi:hypothetical protein